MADKDYLIEIKFSARGTGQVSQGIKNIDGASQKAGLSMSKLAGTALKSIPIWFALRGAYAQVFQTMREGVDYIIEADKGLAKAMAVSTNSTNEFREALEKVGKGAMVETGRNATDVYEAFYQLGTSGIDAGTAMSGMNTVLKTSVALMGDVRTTGRAIADIYNRFGDSIDGAITPLEKFEQIGATVTLLWTKNNFLLNEFTDSFKTFGATAKLANLSFDETAALIASVNNLMVRGTAGGTGLSRSFVFMIQNVKELNKFLQEQGAITTDINLGQTDLLELWQLTAQVLNKIGPDAAKSIKAVQDIFGTKSAQAIGAIAKSYGEYEKNIRLLENNKGAERVAELTRQFEIQKNTIAVQLAVFKNLRNILLETFVVGIAGGDDFAQSIATINEKMKEWAPTVLSVGLGLGFVAEQLIYLLKTSKDGIVDFFKIVDNVSKSNGIGASINAAVTGLALGRPELAALEVLTNFAAKQKGASLDAALTGTSGGLDSLDYIDKLKRDLDERIDKFGEAEGTLTGEAGRIAQAQFGAIKSELDNMLSEMENSFSNSGTLSSEKYADAFSSGVKSELKKVFKGEDTDFFGAINNLFQDQIAEAMASGVTDGLKGAFTGIGGLFGDVENLFQSPTTKMYNSIVDASKKGAAYFRDAITGGSAAATAGIGVSATGGGNIAGTGSAVAAAIGSSSQPTSFLGKLGGGISKVLGAFTGGTGSGGARQLLAAGAASYGISKATGQSGLGAIGGVASFLGLSKQFSPLLAGFQSGYGATGSLAGGLGGANQFGKAAFGAGGSGLSGYLGGALGTVGGAFQAYQGFSSGNNVAGAGGLLTAAGSIISMIPGGQLIGPVIALAGTVTSFFGSGKKGRQTSISTQEETFKVASKIDITNKRLEMIGRDLAGLRQSVETYILPQSAYFSTNTISEQFNIDAKRLLT